MALLGWTSGGLKSTYQHADLETMLFALEHRRQLREVAG